MRSTNREKNEIMGEKGTSPSNKNQPLPEVRSVIGKRTGVDISVLQQYELK